MAYAKGTKKLIVAVVLFFFFAVASAHSPGFQSPVPECPPVCGDGGNFLGR